MPMRYHNITTDDMLNGDGLRVVLWVAGCAHHCKGCQNPVTWDPNGGLIFNGDAWEELENELDKDYISGITFSGGDPLYPSNREDVFEIARNVKASWDNKTVWLYTGYPWETVHNLSGLKYVDVLVDGQFLKDFADINYHWAGSTNQRVIDVQKSLKTGSVVLYEG